MDNTNRVLKESLKKATLEYRKELMEIDRRKRQIAYDLANDKLLPVIGGKEFVALSVEYADIRLAQYQEEIKIYNQIAEEAIAFFRKNMFSESTKHTQELLLNTQRILTVIQKATATESKMRASHSFITLWGEQIKGLDDTDSVKFDSFYEQFKSAFLDFKSLYLESCAEATKPIAQDVIRRTIEIQNGAGINEKILSLTERRAENIQKLQEQKGKISTSNKKVSEFYLAGFDENAPIEFLVDELGCLVDGVKAELSCIDLMEEGVSINSEIISAFIIKKQAEDSSALEFEHLFGECKKAMDEGFSKLEFARAYATEVLKEYEKFQLEDLKNGERIRLKLFEIVSGIDKYRREIQRIAKYFNEKVDPIDIKVGEYVDANLTDEEKREIGLND